MTIRYIFPILVSCTKKNLATLLSKVRRWVCCLWSMISCGCQPEAGSSKSQSWLCQGCQIFLGPNIPNWEKYTNWPQTIPTGHKLYQMAIK
jgi:hypothetical protein